MLGDVVGVPGLTALERLLPGLIEQEKADFVIVNGENVADGFGMTEAALHRILAAGVDVVTSGNHVWEKRDFWPTLNTEARILRPANYPVGTAGRGWITVEKAGARWVVINLQGRELMTAIDCPFRSFDAIVTGLRFPASPALPSFILVDFHAESTREKEALGCYLDGRASVVAGTHTHVQTADERVLPGGTAYITDLGMTGPVAGIIGMDSALCLKRVRTHILYRMECAQGEAALHGILAELDVETGKAASIRRVTAS
jgi:metallophosphoesterase (TIGR00282 family)